MTDDKRGDRFKQGYACVQCAGINKKGDALYMRLENKFVYAGFVMCPEHGIMQGVPRKVLKERIFQTIRILGDNTGLNYLQIRDIFSSDHPDDIHNALEALISEKRIKEWAEEYRVL